MRAFIAIELDEPVRRRLAELQSRLVRVCPGVKWVKPELIHLTLQFLGDIEPVAATEVGAALDAITAGCRPIDLHVHRAGVFPPGGPVRVIWVGAEDAGGALAACREDCRRRLGALGLRDDNRPFSPHLTLGRNKEGRRGMAIRAALAHFADFDAGRQSTAGLTFYESTLTPRGPIYRVVSRHAFAGA